MLCGVVGFIMNYMYALTWCGVRMHVSWVLGRATSSSGFAVLLCNPDWVLFMRMVLGGMSTLHYIVHWDRYTSPFFLINALPRAVLSGLCAIIGIKPYCGIGFTILYTYIRGFRIAFW